MPSRQATPSPAEEQLIVRLAKATFGNDWPHLDAAAFIASAVKILWTVEREPHRREEMADRILAAIAESPEIGVMIENHDYDALMLALEPLAIVYRYVLPDVVSTHDAVTHAFRMILAAHRRWPVGSETNDERPT